MKMFIKCLILAIALSSCDSDSGQSELSSGLVKEDQLVVVYECSPPIFRNDAIEYKGKFGDVSIPQAKEYFLKRHYEGWLSEIKAFGDPVKTTVSDKQDILKDGYFQMTTPGFSPIHLSCIEVGTLEAKAYLRRLGLSHSSHSVRLAVSQFLAVEMGVQE
jgi:hypothetical protein